MNDDYDNHILQKYRLAVALAVIKNTPANSTPQEYLEFLRNNIISKMESYDPDMTICEDDFNFDDDDNNIINDNDKNYKAISYRNENNESPLIDSQTNDSITILKDFDFNDMIRNMNNDRDAIENSSVSDVLRILKDVDNEAMKETEVACTTSDGNNLAQIQSTYYENSQIQIQQTNDIINKDIGQIQTNVQDLGNTDGAQQCDCNNEIKDTIYSTKIITNSTENQTFYDSSGANILKGYSDNFTHISQSQFETIVLPRYLIENKTPKDKSKLPVNHMKENLSSDVSKRFKIKNKSNIETLKPIYDKVGTNVIKMNDKKQVNDNNKHRYAPQDNKDNIKSKRLRNYDDDLNSNANTANFNDIKDNIDANFPNSEIILRDNSKMESNVLFRNLFVNSNVYNEKIDTDRTEAKRYLVTGKKNSLDGFGSQTSIELNNKTNKLGYNSQTFSQFSQEFDSEPSNNKTEAAVKCASNSIKEKTIEEAKESDEEKMIEDLFDKLTDSQAEVVPFKVIEELNKVKSFLNGRNRSGSECISDSGYKSDTQTRSSFKSALQSSNIWLNQSAHCLLTYLVQCPLAVNTEEITKEISRTLGRLIDRLHEDEKYPSFLEEHLHTIDNFLNDIYKGESADKLLHKDETIHRLFLLSKSSHIIKYTTEKIIAILEDVLTMLSEEELLETSHTIQTENLAYIFHILETLIKKLVVYINFSSQQSTQNSQEDEGILKKSSITDIWRKKWNPSKKSDSDPIASVKQCVLVRCSDVLNKVIVQAMDGYSLISYFALQCFNLLQN